MIPRAIILTLVALLAATANAMYRDMAPVDDERLQVLQEIFSACFVPAATATPAVGHMRMLERNLGYIGLTGVNYVFATLGYTDEKTKQELQPLVGTGHMPPDIKIKAKLVKRNLISKLQGLGGERQPMRIVALIERETGKALDKTRAYIDKYQLYQ